MKEKTKTDWKAIAAVGGVIIVAVGAYGILVATGVIDNPWQKPGIVAQIKQGENRNLSFGGYKWRVLDLQDDRALLITEDIIEQRVFNDHAIGTWETCTLRAYLNGAFYREFRAKEQAMILETENVNKDNRWYETDGGNNTMDKVFLLSIEEVVEYFGDSGGLANRKWGYNNLSEHSGGSGGGLLPSKWKASRSDDEFNGDRVATFEGSGDWWWLRSPGLSTTGVALVSADGLVDLAGNPDTFPEGIPGSGVRPALWLKL